MSVWYIIFHWNELCWFKLADVAFTECRVYDDDDDGDDLCYVYVHCTWSPFSVFFVHNQMEACLLHGPFFTSKSSSHVRFTIKNVNLFQVVSECIENTETKKEIYIYIIKLHALYLDKIIQYSSCMKKICLRLVPLANSQHGI